MPQVPNPYFAGPPATHPDTFFGRQDTLRFIDETLASPMHNVIVLYGQRRIGKTSILHQIARRPHQDYQAVLFDLQSRVDRLAPDLFYDLAREVAKNVGLPAPDRADFEDDPDAFLNIFLPQVYRHLESQRLLLLLDEFDALSLEATSLELDASPFVKALNRIIQSHDKRVIFLFVVGRRLKDLSSHQLQIFRGARDRQIGLLKRRAALQLMTWPAEGILSYQDDAVERIWSLTNGHPYFTQLICHEIFSQARRQDTWTVSEAQVEAVIDDAINASQSALRWFWDEVPPLERFTLYTIGQLADERTGAGLDQLIAQRDAQRVQVPDFELRALPDKLVDRQVLRRNPAEKYQFAVELVRRWIIRSHSLEEVTTELTKAAINELAKALFETGRAAYRTGKFDLAVDNFSRALTIDSNYVEARLWLARAYVETGDLLTAINEFGNVERFGGPEQREAQLGLADARAQYGQQLEQDGKIDEAAQEYRRVLEIDPKHPQANSYLSEILRRRGDEKLEQEGVLAAKPLYEQALKHDPAPVLERKIRKRLGEYSDAQAEIHNWEEAERASQLSITLTSPTSGTQDLLDVQLRRGRWHLEQHELETAADVYRRILKIADDPPRQTIENDLLRYSQQQEGVNDWERAEAALTLLAKLFPNDLEHRGRLKENLCHQAEFYLNQDDFARAGAAYRRALIDNPSDQMLRNLIKSGFQSYRRARSHDTSIQTRRQVEEAMGVLVEILGQTDTTAYQWLSEARAKLGDALLGEGRMAEAQEAYQQAFDDITQILQPAADSDQTYAHQETDIRLKLGQIDLDEGKFEPAVERFKQVLADTGANEEIVQRIKTIFNAYRHRQEELLQWNQARRAIEVLNHLFPDDTKILLWLAETSVALAGWHLQRAIPDLDEAQRLTRSALDIELPPQEAEVVIAKVKAIFKRRSEHQEQATNWLLAEQMLNRLVSLIPDDPTVRRWLAETRMRQGDWYLRHEQDSEVEAQAHLAQATAVYQRALNDLPDDDDLLAHLKESFRAYQQRQHLARPALARQAIKTLAGLLPRDEEVQLWVEESATSVSPWQRLRRGERIPLAVVAALVLVLCLGGLVIASMGSNGSAITALFATDTPTPTVTPSSTPTSDPTENPETPDSFESPTSTDTPAAIPTPAPTETSLPPPRYGDAYRDTDPRPDGYPDS